jgi:phosphoribosylformylglycinamidine synthase
MSESQERMMAIVNKKNLKRFEEIMNKWEVEYSILGKVLSDERLVIKWDDEEIVNVPPKTVAIDSPVYERPVEYPTWIDKLNADSTKKLQRATDPSEIASQIVEIATSPNQADKSWITSQYDRYVLGNTALSMPDDGGMIRVNEESGLGITMATDANGKYCQLDPYNGAKLALAEAYRNVAMTGAVPRAVTNCLNFGSPENPEVMWQFKRATEGLADACMEAGIPVTGGNVSFYNQTGETAIYPTPVVGVMGVIDDVARRIPSGWQDTGHNIYLLGTTKDELDGSAWAEVIHGHLGGKPPVVDIQKEIELADLIHGANIQGMIASAHDVSEGGLAQALVESSLRFGNGARIWLGELMERDGIDLTAAMFSESQARAIVSVGREDDVKFVSLCEARGVPVVRIGVTDLESPSLEIQNVADIDLLELKSAYVKTLPELFS